MTAVISHYINKKQMFCFCYDVAVKQHTSFPQPSSLKYVLSQNIFNHNKNIYIILIDYWINSCLNYLNHKKMSKKIIQVQV